MIGEKIAVRRKQLGWTQTDLAQRIGIAPSRISEFESGLKTDCALSTAKRLARALGCSIDYLASTWEEEGAEPPAEAVPEATAAPSRRRGRPRKTVPAGAERLASALCSARRGPHGHQGTDDTGGGDR